MWEKVFDYFQSLTTNDFIRIYWYLFLIEIPRYLFFDYIILVLYYLKRFSTRHDYRRAQNRFWTEQPLISVLAPGKNEGKNIYKLVKSLEAQTYQNYEIIIVDDGSDDDTPIIGRSLEKAGLIDLFIRNQVRGGKASAANLALRYAKGKYILHLDADSSLDRTAIERIITRFYMDDEIGCVGGNLKVRNAKESVAATMQGIEYLMSISVGRMITSYLGIYRIISGAFGAFKTDALKRIGGWDIGPGLDGDVTQKFRKMGYKVAFEDRAICLTSVPTTFKKLAKQRLRWNKSIVRFRLRKHIDVFFPNQNFTWANFLASAENVLFNVVFAFLWLFYMIDIIIHFPETLPLIIAVKLVIYTFINYLQFFALLAVSERWKQEIWFLLYIPLKSIYNGYYMRIIRLMAYIKEMYFYSSYKDAWNPAKTSDKALDHGKL
ncbi:cellulose synthase/poly-beta-1,6-N-acetylglucosamine synthase-like glycosyltransferase [Roseivirga pacifica]|uniref:Glycosyltransferase, catalytic subunit of cellulose synthase and poly-beta-1,6-N-acetylglucosamine synthase n=1 Tax=Roseivirga pacifica TaxID=1267423 RepID=A0A1I0RLZ4_9BACT|nr:glycosyltransferase [Roseivirga pacifica]RKQ49848.1 cellulose synthase/poly-beta-1,6-N-acetylglucosamine synthase-like glycosyltransferase [Roseivirga pacifica]SEW42190.1 Glycosyltransferase, catalytic subunit of cellulose synthase and poly-beta-1,6-N-acetylglucosamine synthase [Roseivirga pacifica]